MKDWQYTRYGLIVLTAILFFIEFGIVYGYGSSPPMNVTERALEEAKKLIAAASNATNVTDLDPDPNPNLGTGTGYYPPPYSYDECLSVFSKESCDFRFNR
jgi:hypothetical protein